jgi:hypothetical protein
MIKFFSWFPWVFVRRAEFDLLAGNSQRLDAALDRVARIEAERLHEAREHAATLAELNQSKLLFDRLVLVVPRLSGAKAQGLTLFLPRPVLDSLKKAGSVVVLEFAKELGRRLVLRAFKELFDHPAESINLPH